MGVTGLGWEMEKTKTKEQKGELEPNRVTDGQACRWSDRQTYAHATQRNATQRNVHANIPFANLIG